MINDTVRQCCRGGEGRYGQDSTAAGAWNKGLPNIGLVARSSLQAAVRYAANLALGMTPLRDAG
jgi:hypothetical protein